jgi:hypothetical protein
MNFFLEMLLSLAWYLLNGIALKLLWGWFLTPTFGLLAVSFPQALGIVLFLGFLFAKHKDMKEEKGIKEIIFDVFYVPLFSIAVGWVIQLFM